jgi:hypothetical protein
MNVRTRPHESSETRACLPDIARTRDEFDGAGRVMRSET